MAEFGDDQLGGVGVDHLIDRGQDAIAHQAFDHIGAALGHTVGQLLHRDGLGDHHVAHHLLGGLHRLLHALAFAGALHRGQRAAALAAIFVQGGADGQLAFAAARLVALDHRHRLVRRRAARTLGAIVIFFFGFRHGGGSGGRSGSRGGGRSRSGGSRVGGARRGGRRRNGLGGRLGFRFRLRGLHGGDFGGETLGLFLGGQTLDFAFGGAAAGFFIGLQRVLQHPGTHGLLTAGEIMRDMRQLGLVDRRGLGARPPAR